MDSPEAPLAHSPLLDRAWRFTQRAYDQSDQAKAREAGHLTETARILADAGYDDEVTAAGLLHDVVEDTRATVEDVRREYGDRVGGIVAALTEDDSIDGYEERKHAHREQVREAGPEAGAVFAADKLSKLRRLEAGAPLPQKKLDHYRRTLEMLRDMHPEISFLDELSALITERERAAASEAEGSEAEDDQPRRDETEAERIDRNLNELLAELRVALPGVQVLFAFLLTVPFSQRFSRLSGLEETIYYVTLLCTAISTMLLIAPTAHHRVEFRQKDKAHIVKTANRLVLVGLAFLATAMAGAVLLITDLIFGGVAAALAGVATLLAFAWLWYALPLSRIRGRRHRSHGSRPSRNG